MFVLERPWIGQLDFFNDLRYPVRPEKRRAFAFFDFADLFGNFGAPVQQRQQFPV